MSEDDPCPYVLGLGCTDEQATAWTGFLGTHRRLTRDLDLMLQREYHIGLSELEVLGRLQVAPHHCQRLSALASSTGLSLSRISRLTEQLSNEGWLERRQCQEDARAVNAVLSEKGVLRTEEAQTAHLRAVQQRFFAELSAEEDEVLSRVFTRLAAENEARA